MLTVAVHLAESIYKENPGNSVKMFPGFSYIVLSTVPIRKYHKRCLFLQTLLSGG